MNLRLRLGIEWLVIALLASAIVAGLSLSRATAPFDNLLYDRASALSPAKPDPNILLVNIDDASLAELGKWPWDRARHAALIEQLKAAGARSILLDVILSEPGDPASDPALAKSMMGGAPTYIPVHFATPGSDGRDYDVIRPAPVFDEAAAGKGHVNLAIDGDGIVRRAELCFRANPGDPDWPHAVERVYRGAGGKSSPAYRSLGACSEQLLLPFAKPGSFAEIPYARALAGEVPPGMIKGRDIFIGATAPGLGDSYPVANGGGALMAGTEIMANMLTALRADNFVRPLEKPLQLLASLIPLWLLMLAFLRWRPRVALLLSLGSIALLMLASWSLLQGHIWFAPGAALIGILLVYPLWGWRRLQAMSDFMDRELRDLEENDQIGLPLAEPYTGDMVGRQSAALASAIDQLHGLRRFVADILDELPDPMLVTDMDGIIVVTNEQLDARMGRSTVGEKFSEALGPRVSNEIREEVLNYFRTQKSGSGESSIVRFNDLDGRALVLRRSALHGEGGRLIGHIQYFTDITDLARAEAQREEVLQLLSHDMRAPQSAIIALLGGTIDADAKQRIEHNARRTMALAQNFVDIARMGETPFDGEDILLVDLVQEAADSLWPLAKERGVTLAISDESDDAFVHAEPDSLQRAFCNIIDNAIKFSPDGSSVDIAVTRENGRVIISIRDHGKGITPELLPQLFGRFVNSGEDSARVKSTGLGLSYVRAVMERHQGRAEAANAPDGGAVFTLSLPEAADPA